MSPYADEKRYTRSVTISSFKGQIALTGFLRKFVPATGDSFTLSRNRVALTFDDGYRDLLDDAIPYLIANNIPATVFINSSTLSGNILWRDKLRLILDAGPSEEFCETLPAGTGITWDKLYVKSKSPDLNSVTISRLIDDFVEKKGLGLKERLYKNAKELQQLNAEINITLGNHTRNHFVLSSLSNEEQKTEINGGLRDLVEHGLNVSDIFAAPFGRYATVNEQTFKLLKEDGYTGILLTNGNERVNFEKLPPRTELVVANRYLPKNRYYETSFKKSTSGAKEEESISFHWASAGGIPIGTYDFLYRDGAQRHSLFGCPIESYCRD